MGYLVMRSGRMGLLNREGTCIVTSVNSFRIACGAEEVLLVHAVTKTIGDPAYNGAPYLTCCHFTEFCA
jgi:hypothetical protein